jgi:hypothetical protein
MPIPLRFAKVPSPLPIPVSMHLAQFVPQLVPSPRTLRQFQQRQLYQPTMMMKTKVKLKSRWIFLILESFSAAPNFKVRLADCLSRLRFHRAEAP